MIALCIICRIMLLTSLFKWGFFFFLFVRVKKMFAFYIFVFSLWQQAGRSGRRGKPSLAVYIALEGPLDQYFMKFPQKLFGSPIECCQVDAHNQQVFLLVFTHGPFFFFFSILWTHTTFPMKHMHAFMFAYLYLKVTTMVHFKECYCHSFPLWFSTLKILALGGKLYCYEFGLVLRSHMINLWGWGTIMWPLLEWSCMHWLGSGDPRDLVDSWDKLIYFVLICNHPN